MRKSFAFLFLALAMLVACAPNTSTAQEATPQPTLTPVDDRTDKVNICNGLMSGSETFCLMLDMQPSGSYLISAVGDAPAHIFVGDHNTDEREVDLYTETNDFDGVVEVLAGRFHSHKQDGLKTILVQFSCTKNDLSHSTLLVCSR